MYQHILVPVDGGLTSNSGLAEAIRLAKMTHGRLRLIHVIDELSFAMSMDSYVGYIGDWLEELRQAGAKLLQDARSKALADGVEADTVLRDELKGPVDEIVIDEAKTWPVDIIVIGTHGRRGVGRLVMGSSAERILRHASVPVLLIRADPAPAPEGQSASTGVGQDTAAAAA
jgi:nucleotide-binding universal stress UspA family protein